MVTISHYAKKLVEERLLLDEYLCEGIINYYALAERLKPRIERELGKEARGPSIAMALRRLSETKRKKDFKIPSFKDSELIMKSNLCDIAVLKSSTLFKKLTNIYNLVDYNKGDFLNIVHGNHEVSIIINKKFEKEALNHLKGEKVLNIEDDLVALTIRLKESYLHTPGITYALLKPLVLENVNLIEVFSSLIETTVIIDKKESTKAYSSLQDWIDTFH